jgi:type IV pilus assembly protein PilE
MNRQHSRGVTLIELMTVLVVLAILASIAVPSYRQYLIRSQRTEATAALLRLSAAQEKFFLQNNQYTDDLGAPPAGLGIGAVTDNGRYDIAIALGAGNTTYAATATPAAGGGQEDDPKCRVFGINEAGQKTAEDGGGADITADCWR